MQIMPFDEARNYPFNPFDLIKVWPHSDYPLVEVGELTLEANAAGVGEPDPQSIDGTEPDLGGHCGCHAAHPPSSGPFSQPGPLQLRP
jgi:Catalase